MKKIIERTLWLGLLFSLLALVGVVAVMLAYPTVALMKIAPIIGYIMVVAVEIALIMVAIKERKEGVIYVIAGAIYALAIVLL